MDEFIITNNEKFKHLEGFGKAHRKAALSYCRKHKIDPSNIHAITVNDCLSITYEYEGKVFLTASLTYIPKVKLKFRNQ